MHLEIDGPRHGLGNKCEIILRSLPDWFGIEQSIIGYAKEIDVLDTFVAICEDQLVGFMSVKKLPQNVIELYVLAVLPQYQGKGIGRSLLNKVEEYCRPQDITILQVKTLSSSRPNEAYEKTRQCYRAWGFRPFEELPEIWGKDNPCLVMIKTL